MKWIILITGAIGTIYMLYQAYIAIAGNLRKLKPIAYAAPTKRIAVTIPARNEEKVVVLLIDSLLKQQYPRELYDIYVIPNNCTDNTEQAARRAGARIISCQTQVRSKGDVLHLTFDKLLKGDKDYDGFVIFDADNIADGGFLQVVNNALSAGYQVGQAYRDSKNPDDNWVTGCTSAFFWFMNRFFNHSRAALGLSASLNGTGIMFGADFLRRIGYNTTTLTEDLEFNAQCALAGEKIAWMEEAITYDEQPLKLKDSFTQRRRWAAGTRQCASKYLVSLFKGARKNRVCLDVALHFLGVYTMVLGLIPGILTCVLLLKGIIQNPVQGSLDALVALAGTLAVCLLGGAAITLLVCVMEGKMRRQRWADAFAMGWYLVTWLPANLMGYLWKPPVWTAIPHTIEVGIEECEQSGEGESGVRPYEQKENTL